MFSLMLWLLLFSNFSNLYIPRGDKSIYSWFFFFFFSLLSLLYPRTTSHLLYSGYSFVPTYECQQNDMLASFKILTGSLSQKDSWDFDMVSFFRWPHPKPTRIEIYSYNMWSLYVYVLWLPATLSTMNTGILEV